jgi:cytoskeletal protein RodZ
MDMSEDLKRVGHLFKNKRKDLNLTLKDVENSTSIRVGYLEAIEEGSIHQFISGIYAIGFMKQYASFLGIDFDGIVREIPHAFKLPQEKHEFDYGIGTLEVRGSLGGGVKWLPSFLWAVGVAGLLVVTWYLAKYLGVL